MSSLGPNCQQFHGKISVIRVPLNLVDTSGCHDITVLAPRQLAAAACLSVGQIWDIRNIRRPEPLMTLDTSFVRAWHSAQFTLDGSASRSAMRPAAGCWGAAACRTIRKPERSGSTR